MPLSRDLGFQALYAGVFSERIRQALECADDLTNTSVNLVRLPQHSWSSPWHWHTREEEFVHDLAGELTLMTHAGEQCLLAGNFQPFQRTGPTATTSSTRL